MATDVQELLDRSLRDLQAPANLAERIATRYARRRRRRRVTTGVGAAVLTAATVIAAWAALDTSPQAGRATIVPATPAPASGELIPEAQRRPAPELAGTTIEGKALRVDLRRGETAAGNEAITVVTFGGSWCAPCRAQQPAFAPFNNGRVPVAGGGFIIVGVAERDTVANAAAYARRFHVDYPILFDADQSLAKAWPSANVGPPVTFVVDQDGLIAAQFRGAITRSQLSNVKDALTSEQRGGTFSNHEFIAGLHNVTSSGRHLTISWANDRCGDTVQAVLSQVRVRENVRAIHVEVLGKLSPAVLAGQQPTALTGCAGVGFDSTTTVTLSAPLGKRLVLDGSTGKSIPVQGRG
jgi:peroxiredoxin